ncbi:thioesterase II family protein [Nocardia sp. NPDC055321]
MNSGANRWIRTLSTPGNTAPRLLCFPHAGGSASYYYPLSKALASTCEVLAVQYPGRQDRLREPCLASIHELADAVCEQTLPLVDRPIALFGHSMGSLVAYEVARRLEQHGALPSVLFVSGRRAPSTYREENTHLLDDQQLLSVIRMLDGTDPRLLDDQEVRDMILPSVRADYRAIGTYHHRVGPLLTIPIHAHIGISDSRVNTQEARAWSDHTVGDFELRTYPGGHFYLSEQVDALSSEIRRTINA